MFILLLSFSLWSLSRELSIIFSVVSNPISDVIRISSISSKVLSSSTALRVTVSLIVLTILERVLDSPFLSFEKLILSNRFILSPF